jgi:hypothetical protein
MSAKSQESLYYLITPLMDKLSDNLRLDTVTCCCKSITMVIDEQIHISSNQKLSFPNDCLCLDQMWKVEIFSDKGGVCS